MKRKIVTEQNDLFGSYEHFSRDELINLIDRETNKVPEEYRSTVKFLIDTGSDMCSDTSYPKFFISYSRLETDKEFETRVASDAAFAKHREEQDRKTYERLKKQFEGK